MDNYQGDLTDIIRASYGSCSTGICSSSEAAPQFSSSDPLNFSSGNFGDPFSNTRDPFLYEPHNYMPGSAYFNSASSGALEEETACFGSGDYTCVLAQKNIIDEDDKRRPMIQISPVTMDALSRVVKPSSAAVSSGNKPSKHRCLVDNTQVQIQSRYPAFKRRKSQAKKSICVPAPAAPNSRQGGEVVPSDLWAWRKYGQKPIKGSPYPRGYYRCSSSKGCPARKQVERSRTDPNMLVITYTSEHNHPWPTHRAASSRSQPSNTNNNNNNNVAALRKEEQEEEESNSESNVSPIVVNDSNTSPANNSASVKEEKQQLEMEDGEFSEGLSHKMKCNQLDHDLFAELGEIEAHSLNLLSRFHLFDWTGDINTKYHIV